MIDFMLIVLAALTVAGLAWGLFAFTIGREPGLSAPEPDGLATPIPAKRPLSAQDLGSVRFDVTLRGYDMAQVDQFVAAATETVRHLEERARLLETEAAELRRLGYSDPA